MNELEHKLCETEILGMSNPFLEVFNDLYTQVGEKLSKKVYVSKKPEVCLSLIVQDLVDGSSMGFVDWTTLNFFMSLIMELDYCPSIDNRPLCAFVVSFGEPVFTYHKNYSKCYATNVDYGTSLIDETFCTSFISVLDV